jgi:hypothetical protein
MPAAIHVYAKTERVVRISANPMGRMVVEDLWPDVEWTTDEKFSTVHSREWHIFSRQKNNCLPTTRRLATGEVQ